uniref:2-amino-4-hydroxy-6- hydroxymethyldihydropteridine diphosphokinase n=1 Tax=Segatella hominis TaxID=2518605 RepID=UPI0040256EBD
MHKVYLSLGTNLGNRKRNIREAIEKIEELVGVVERQSALYETKPWGFSSPNDFINACVLVDTILAPRQLLDVLQGIEKEMGRTLKSVNGEYHDRIIDIDILLYDDLKIDEPDLKIPHPLMEEREFVMVPLREILCDYFS